MKIDKYLRNQNMAHLKFTVQGECGSRTMESTEEAEEQFIRI